MDYSSDDLSPNNVHLEELVLAEDREKKIYELYHPEEKPGFFRKLIGDDLSNSGKYLSKDNYLWLFPSMEDDNSAVIFRLFTP